MSPKRSRTEKSDKLKQPESSRSKSLFVSKNAKFKHSVICKKNVISDHLVVLADFEHLNLANILISNSLEYSVTIREQVYPELVQVFYSNLTFDDNRIQSRLKGVDINISVERFGQNFQLSCEGVDIFNLTFHDFEYLDDETALTASRLLHDDDNSALVRNEDMKYHTLITQVLAKIVFNNLLPKSGAYSHARGCAPLLIYYLLKGIRVNILHLIVDFMLFEHLLIPSRNLPF